MVCFLHPESLERNRDVIAPPEVEAACRKAGIGDSELVVLAPGDSWHDKQGFERSSEDYYHYKDARIARMAAEVRPQIERSMAEEAGRELSYEAFEAYFSRFLGALPPGSGRLLRRPIVFEVRGSSRPYWVINVRRRVVSQSSELPPDWASMIEVPPGVLADAIEQHIVNLIHISMRLPIRLAPGGVETDLVFWGVLIIWELGYLPIRKLLNPRMLGVEWRRRREFWHTTISRFAGRDSFAERMTANMMSDDASGA